MFDYLCLEVRDVNEGDWRRIKNNITKEITESFDKSDKLSFSWYNLKVSYYYNEKKIIIKNSLHKFSNLISSKNDHNADNFSFWDNIVIIDYICIILEKEPSEIYLFSKMEYGFNIDVSDLDFKPFSIIENYTSISNRAINPFYTIASTRGKPIQRNADFTDWRFKTYDKGAQLKEPSIKDILRMELVSHRLKHTKAIFKKDVVTLDLLCDPENWVTLFQHFISIYDKIYKIPLMMKEMNKEDVIKMHQLVDPVLDGKLKKTLEIKEYNKYRYQLRKVFDKYDKHPNNLHNQIRDRIYLKFIELYNS